jgi:hypothetical protein
MYPPRKRYLVLLVELVARNNMVDINSTESINFIREGTFGEGEGEWLPCLKFATRETTRTCGAYEYSRGID